jgi:uncharacterized protein
VSDPIQQVGLGESNERFRGPNAHCHSWWLGDWAGAIDGADAVINLAGRTVSCRYTEENLKQMMDSRVESTLAVGEAIAQARQPPKVWLQMSSHDLC